MAVRSQYGGIKNITGVDPLPQRRGAGYLFLACGRLCQGRKCPQAIGLKSIIGAFSASATSTTGIRASYHRERGGDVHNFYGLAEETKKRKNADNSCRQRPPNQLSTLHPSSPVTVDQDRADPFSSPIAASLTISEPALSLFLTPTLGTTTIFRLTGIQDERGCGHCKH